MSGEAKESILPSLDGPMPIPRRKCASEPVSPRGKSAGTGRPGKNILGSATPAPHLRNDGFHEAASVLERQYGIHQSLRADSPRPGGLRTRAADSVESSPEGLSSLRSLVSVRSMPVIPVEQDYLAGSSLEEYVHSLYTIPQKTRQLLPPQSSPMVAADSDPKPPGRQSVSSTLIPSQKGGSLAVAESDTDSPPMPLMKDYYASSDECTSTSVSSKSVVSDEVGILDFVRTSGMEEGRRSMGATEPPRGDPGTVAEQGEVEFGKTPLAFCGHLPRASPGLKPFSLGLSLNTDVEKDIMNDPDPSFHRAAGSPGGPIKEAFVEQVGSAFYIKNLRNDSLGRLPQITPVERSFSGRESPELMAIQESSPGGCRSRGSETFSSNSSNETIRPGTRNVVILPEESNRRYHSTCCRRSHGEMDIGSAAIVGLEGEGSVSPPYARHQGATAPEGPSRPPASPATPAAAASPEAAWVRAANEEFSSLSFSLLRKEKGSVVLERKPFPPGQGGSDSQGIYPAPPIKTTVLCYTNVLPEQPRVPTPVLTVGDDGTGQPDSPSDSLEFSSVRRSHVSVASSMLHASGRVSGLEGSKSLRSVRALLLNEGIQLKESNAGSGDGTPGLDH